MRIASIEIKGFRCFDDVGQAILLDDFTCFVGPNASGKTAAMLALVRMFGERQADRSITKSDFHLAPGEKLGSKKERSLSIEVRLVFPDLERREPVQGSSECGEGHDSYSDAIPEVFNQMIVDEPGGTPYCRIRLESSWINDGTADGDITQALYWITAPIGTEETDGHRHPVRAWQRARIRVVYEAASRDPARQMRPRVDSSFGTLLRAVDWDGSEEKIKRHVHELAEILSDLPGLRSLNENIQRAWTDLYDGQIAGHVVFARPSEEPTSLLESIDVTFEPDELGNAMSARDLSDGLRALFALSLPMGLYSVGEKIRSLAEGSGFVESVRDQLPYLTIFAVEEPENHLSPHYLGKVVAALQGVAAGTHAQVVVSSHSPSILQRVEPEHVRYFLGGETRTVTQVRLIPLPPVDGGEVYKYVREAVRGYPELYFSRLVVLGEGPSEAIVFRKVFEASGAPLDVLFISVVPLGGKHVHHFWRLLTGLGIPHITVLDLDKGRKTGGLDRIQYVIDQLTMLHGNDVEQEIARAKVSEPDDEEGAVIRLLGETYNVFFFAPLDLDWAMLQAFPEVYKAQAPDGRGPRWPDAEPKRSETLRNRARQVLGADDGEEIGPEYDEEQYEFFAWYKYLFLDRSKPTAHRTALVHLLEDPDWYQRLPDPLPRIVDRAVSLVGGGGRDS